MYVLDVVRNMEPVIRDIVGPFDGKHTPCALNVVIMITINRGVGGGGRQKPSWGRIGYRLIGLAEGFLESDLGKIVLRERYLIYRLGNGMGYISTCYIICREIVTFVLSVITRMYLHTRVAQK